MGLSVSGATAVILIGAVISFSTFYPAIMTTYTTHSDAIRDQSDRIVAQLNTDFAATNASYNATNESVTVTINNTGPEPLDISRLDVLVDGEYISSAARTATVVGRSSTRAVLANETLTIDVPATTEPERVKVISETGVARIVEVI
ncbi:MAG: putative archaeal flagellar protein F [halophilic archaeon J07HX5]|nr:MAG: putative archaeal flagellar protein F [halophilic archaeon J07HX5]